MRAKVWGARGTIPSPGPQMTRYGGNTSCVSVEGEDGTLLVLDAGSGIRLLGGTLPRSLQRVDILLTHLHMDHIIGLGFFSPLRWPEVEAHIWGPTGTALDLKTRLMRHLSPPYFPLHINELGSQLTLHEIADSRIEIGGFEIASTPVCHPGPTLGYRVSGPNGKRLAYLPDHEPALGVADFPLGPEWTSGFGIAEGADLLFHDAQYTDEEYAERTGWGHSTMAHALAFARMCGVRRMAIFHHDPNRSDAEIDAMVAGARNDAGPAIALSAAAEGEVFEVG
jgi:ribonuclease BN (tRNA processing enzyme)